MQISQHEDGLMNSEWQVGTSLLELRDVTKRYPGVVANEGIHLCVMPGQIHAVVGENGAGKSTLMKIIYGAVKPDEGEMRWEGKHVDFVSPAETRQRGIGMVFQHFSLFETISVAQNIELCLQDSFAKGEVAARIVTLSERYGMSVDPCQRVGALSVGERQQVEIIRSLMLNPRLLILDEPTAVLSPQAVQALLATLRQLAVEGRAILYISHKLDEIKALCDCATVLRNGRVVGHVDMESTSPNQLASLMTGHQLPSYTRNVKSRGKVVLSVKDLNTPPRRLDEMPLQNIGFEVRAGEIVGIAGVSGNGQGELLDVLSGERSVHGSDVVQLMGEPAGSLSPRERRRHGFAYVPEERLGHGAVPEMSLEENLLLTSNDQTSALPLTRWGLVRTGEVRERTRAIVRGFRVKAAGSESLASSLSGGNLQKFIVGRELAQQPQVLVVAQPTWGVDIAAAMFLRQQLLDMAANGRGVLVISEDLDELMQICDRIMVMAKGRLSPSLPTEHATAEQIGLWMAGMFDGHQANASQPSTTLGVAV